MISEEILKQIRPGTRVKVYEKGGMFEGLVLARKHGRQAGGTFTVRAKLADVGVEKVYPIYSPNIKKVEILAKPRRKVRRAKLYYLRNLSEKKIRQKLGV
ncbi:MAG TPA: 50S ribosomal protein L19 [Candidatus Paceibacterota bacterium]